MNNPLKLKEPTTQYSYFCEHIIKIELLSITARPALAPEFWVPEDMFDEKTPEVSANSR